MSSSASNDALKEDQEKISEAMKLSKEEKSKLYEAIGYTEENKTNTEYPNDVNEIWFLISFLFALIVLRMNLFLFI